MTPTPEPDSVDRTRELLAACGYGQLRYALLNVDPAQKEMLVRAIMDDMRSEPKQRARSLPTQTVYRRVTMKDGDTFIFKHTQVKRGKSWKPQNYAPLVRRYADLDQAIVEVKHLNSEEIQP